MSKINATCGLTNLPIRENDDIVVILLKEKSLGELRGGQFCYTDDLFTPISAPIFAKYDGYGSIKDVDFKYSSLVLKQLKSLFLDKHLGDVLSVKENSSSINIKSASLEDIVYEFERGNVIQKISDETLELYKNSGEFHRGYYFTGLVMFHKDVFEKIVAYDNQSTLYLDNFALAENFGKVDLKKEMGKEAFRTLMNKIILDSRTPRSGCKYFDIYLYWYENCEKLTVNTELLNYLRDGVLFINAMKNLNKTWMPQVSAFIQEDDNLDVYNFLNKCIAEQIETLLNPKEEIKEEVEFNKDINLEDLEIIKSIESRFNISGISSIC